jgi:hypothetical protein
MNFWAPLAVAAALLVLFFGPKFWGRSNPLPAPQATAWSLPESVEELQWTIDGEPVAPSDGRDQIVQRLASAQRVGALPGGALRLAYGRLFQVEVAEGSELDLSQFRSADSAAVYRLGMLGDSGGFCFRTGPDFKRNRCELIFQTPEAEIAVVGTVFAVDRYTSEQSMAGTCVCCSEGTVQVNGTYDRKGVTEAGGSCFVVPGNKPLMEGEVQGDHLQPMLRLAEAEVPETWLD